MNSRKILLTILLLLLVVSPAYTQKTFTESIDVIDTSPSVVYMEMQFLTEGTAAQGYYLQEAADWLERQEHLVVVQDSIFTEPMTYRVNGFFYWQTSAYNHPGVLEVMYAIFYKGADKKETILCTYKSVVRKENHLHLLHDIREQRNVLVKAVSSVIKKHRDEGQPVADEGPVPYCWNYNYDSERDPWRRDELVEDDR